MIQVSNLCPYARNYSPMRKNQAVSNQGPSVAKELNDHHTERSQILNWGVGEGNDTRAAP
jgi:hypothetical protein